MMKVCKFENITDEDEIIKVMDRIWEERPYLVVLPAMEPIKEWLKQISIGWFQDDAEMLRTAINELLRYCCSIADHLVKDRGLNNELKNMIWKCLDNLSTWTQDRADLLVDRNIKAEGYRLSCFLLAYCLRERGLNAKMLDTEMLMQIGSERKPDIPYIQEAFKKNVNENRDADLFVAPLGLCRNVYGETDFMSEKCNDYYATVLATVFHADEVALWTETDGIYTNPGNIREQHCLNYDEAENLINSGVNLLYEDCVSLAARSGLAIRVMDIRERDKERLYISSMDTQGGVKAILTQDAVTFVRFKSLDVLPGYLLLGKILEVIGKHKIHVVSMTSSNVSVSMVMAASRDSLWIIQRELSKYTELIIDDNMSVVHIVGSFQWEQTTTECDIMQTVRSIPVSLISYGSTDHCFTLAVHTVDKQRLLNLITQSYLSTLPFSGLLHTMKVLNN